MSNRKIGRVMADNLDENFVTHLAELLNVNREGLKQTLYLILIDGNLPFRNIGKEIVCDDLPPRQGGLN